MPRYPSRPSIPPVLQLRLINPKDANLDDVRDFLQAGVDVCLDRGLRSQLARQHAGRIPSRRTLVVEMQARGSRVHESTFDRRWKTKNDYCRDLASFAQSLFWLDEVLERMRSSLLVQAQSLAMGRVSLSSVVDEGSIANIRRRIRMAAAVRKLNSLLGGPANMTELAKVERWRKGRHECLWLPVYATLAGAAKFDASSEFLREFTSLAAILAEGYATAAYLEQLTIGDQVDFARHYGEKLGLALKSYIRSNINVGSLL
ncbi:hypothetical protein ACH4OY_07410 [Micromonospora rubida]|uniref:Uncharacterized protein n=1 Tax=Micromonospora rubida TaxID=2697657 RepID=A0ABW7SFQ2_9ACTN